MRHYLQLGKFSIMLPVSLSAFTGYCLFHPSGIRQNLLISIGVLLLGMSASAINQFIEKERDARMIRTLSRPLVSGKISIKHAFFYILVTFLAGTWFIFAYGNLLAVSLGIFNLLWYNLVYTPLKPKTAFAVLPGAVTGAVPPLIGWTAAGGPIGGLPGLLLAFVFFMGQIPHFWMIILQYRLDYKGAGFKSILEKLSEQQINRLNLLWINAALTSALLFTGPGILSFRYSQLFITLLVLVSIAISLIFHFKPSNRQRHRQYFFLLNGFFLMLMGLLVADRFIMLHHSP